MDHAPDMVESDEPGIPNYARYFGIGFAVAGLGFSAMLLADGGIARALLADGLGWAFMVGASPVWLPLACLPVGYCLGAWLQRMSGRRYARRLLADDTDAADPSAAPKTDTGPDPPDRRRVAGVVLAIVLGVTGLVIGSLTFRDGCHTAFQTTLQGGTEPWYAPLQFVAPVLFPIVGIVLGIAVGEWRARRHSRRLHAPSE